MLAPITVTRDPFNGTLIHFPEETNKVGSPKAVSQNNFRRKNCNMYDYKQVIVVRNDLKMGKGKLAVQVAHAAVSSAENTRKNRKDWFDSWYSSSQAKICVKVDSEKELRVLKGRLDEMGIPNSLIQDAGLTQLEPGTTTCLGIGPLPSEMADRYTGDLKLL
jgi:peptidyl-tRNA hydrolase, PTH2 family